MKREAMSLQPILVDAPFMQWTLDVIGPINPKSSPGHAYILTATNYFIKWKETRALKEADTSKLILVIEENILSRFGVPQKFIIDNGTFVVESKFTSFCGKYGITMGQS